MKAVSALFFSLISLFAQLPEPARTRLLRSMDDSALPYNQLSPTIWEYAEVGYQETRSSALLRQHLEKAGFRVTANRSSASWASSTRGPNSRRTPCPGAACHESNCVA